jgi:NADP-dependent aldehyde dehydrogenase
MELHGKNVIGGIFSGENSKTFHGVDPSTSTTLEPAFYEATDSEIDAALVGAEKAFSVYRSKTPEQRATFLEKVAEEVEALGEALIDRADAETALGRPRLSGERGRTVGQLRMFASLIRKGSWVDARIDHADPNRTPVPKPDVRRMRIPIGPCVVFGASNFPLAFSAAGGDSASALAAGCPVVLKAHPAHPGTSEMVTHAFLAAARATGMPEGLFSMIHGTSPEVSVALVTHPLTKAVGFTGSLRAGRALFNAAAARPEPIPVYAEMGSVNPTFVFPGVLKDGQRFSEGFFGSMTLGVGQFCTNPGLVVGMETEEMGKFKETLGALVEVSEPETMLHAGILSAYEAGVEKFSSTSGVTPLARCRKETHPNRTQAGAALFSTNANTFLGTKLLGEELFGPSTLLVGCHSNEEMLEVARSLEGSLTASVHGTPEELAGAADLIRILERKAGRLLFNGFPTGVEVCAAMQHGGPYPATTDSRITSVGAAAIERFARPVAFQNFPDEALPLELRNKNERGIWRLVDNQLTMEDA